WSRSSSKRRRRSAAAPFIPMGSSGSARTIWRRPPDTPTRGAKVLAYMRFLGGGNVDEARLSAFVDRSPEALKFFENCGVRFRVVGGVTDHYYDKAPGSHAVGRCIEADLVSGFDLGDWRERVSVPHDVPCFVTAEEQVTWGGL